MTSTVNRKVIRLARQVVEADEALMKAERIVSTVREIDPDNVLLAEGERVVRERRATLTIRMHDFTEAHQPDDVLTFDGKVARAYLIAMASK